MTKIVFNCTLFSGKPKQHNKKKERVEKNGTINKQPGRNMPRNVRCIDQEEYMLLVQQSHHT